MEQLELGVIEPRNLDRGFSGKLWWNPVRVSPLGREKCFPAAESLFAINAKHVLPIATLHVAAFARKRDFRHTVRLIANSAVGQIRDDMRPAKLRCFATELAGGWQFL